MALLRLNTLKGKVAKTKKFYLKSRVVCKRFSHTVCTRLHSRKKVVVTLQNLSIFEHLLCQKAILSTALLTQILLCKQYTAVHSVLEKLKLLASIWCVYPLQLFADRGKFFSVVDILCHRSIIYRFTQIYEYLLRFPTIFRKKLLCAILTLLGIGNSKKID